MPGDEDRGYRAGRRAGTQFARNPQQEPKDPTIPSTMTDSEVYLRNWREGWVDGMTDPNGPDFRRNPARRITVPVADAPPMSSPTGDTVLGEER
ncbi:hypothetical protein [Rhodococcus zopfii]|uniref:hypothetical protein n=1 Tax=Rhodococcus zopfii TaxID=43772 RepID=UPI0009323287|nr:hypothetical protein [Rhodococcus zopfii]